MAAKKKEPEPTAGEQMVAEILTEFTEAKCQPTATESALLDTARELVDRLDQLSLILARDGLMVSSPTGPRVHPAAVEHRALAVALPRVLSSIVIGDSTSGVVKSKTHQKAVNARWDRRDRLREVQAERAGL